MKKAAICDDAAQTHPNTVIRYHSRRKDLSADVREILFFESDKNYYIAHMKTGKTFRKRGTISSLERDLAPLGFFRTHAAYLVNLNYADRSGKSRNLTLGDKYVPIAQKRFSRFLKAYTKIKSPDER